MSEAVSAVTFEEFLAAERAGGARHEWVVGFAYAMAGGSEHHDTMVEALRDVLGPGARHAGCRRFTGNHLVRTASAAYYPADAGVRRARASIDPTLFLPPGNSGNN